MFKKAAKKFSEIGRLSIAAKHLKEVGRYAGKRVRISGEFGGVYGSRGSLFRENTESTANQCKLRVASLAGQLEQCSVGRRNFRRLRETRGGE